MSGDCPRTCLKKPVGDDVPRRRAGRGLQLRRQQADVDEAPGVDRGHVAFTSSLWTPGHKRTGSLNASCIVTSGGTHPVFECTGTFSLAGGQLELQTTMRDGDNPTNIAIVGGTGAFEGALGSIKAVSRGANSRYTDDTVHLLPRSA
jgi:hypothetical protein